MKITRGTSRDNAKLTNGAVRYIRSSIGNKKTPTELARKYKVSRALIYRVVSRFAWAHIK